MNRQPYHLEEWILRLGETETNCDHLDQISEVTPSANGCEDCMKTGDSWVHLRLCLTCGHVGCCDNSKNKHATRHFQETGHPLITSFEPGEHWAWCYEEKIVMTPRSQSER